MKELPRSLAWVVPVPAVPDHYAVEPAKVFEELFKLVEESRPRPPAFSRGVSVAAVALKKILQRVTVGEYEIQPIRARGADAGPALNAWLSENGFGAVPVENMKYYLDASWTFLAVKMSPPQDRTSLEKEGGFRPLRISFASNRIVYPLKFSSHQGAFGVTLYVLTEQGLASEEGGRLKSELAHRLAKFDFFQRFPATNVYGRSTDFQRKWPELAKLWSSVRNEGRVKFEQGTVNMLVAVRVNTRVNLLSDWAEDFSIEMK